MATLVLGALGTVFGGPIGGAIGALAGRQIDAKIMGSGTREGPRLKELDVTTSSYGSPLSRHFGTMRVSGTIIWATDLVESKEKSGGGKGRPKTTSYSYSSSFAVALSSRPIKRIGRIWADGNLLRGTAGDLKAGGTLRIYTGAGDQPSDPLMAAAAGGNCPAYRGCAYVVFEDLQLADFGNRIPALTFEVIADDDEVSSEEFFRSEEKTLAAPMRFSGLTGISHEGGSYAGILSTLDLLYPMQTSIADGSLMVEAESEATGQAPLLPAASAWEDGEFGKRTGVARERANAESALLTGLRYYDVSRDNQRAIGRSRPAQDSVLQFPGALEPANARSLINQAAQRAEDSREIMQWRLIELDERFRPGTTVRVPGSPGLWTITGWEWREKGVELELKRAARQQRHSVPADGGTAPPAADWVPSETYLRAFELPGQLVSSGDQPKIYAAVGSSDASWRGAALYANAGGILDPLGPSGRGQATMAKLVEPLPPSPSLRFEALSRMDVETVSEDHLFSDCSTDALASGRNRLILNDEIIQFTTADRLSSTRWQLSGLLRGRGGTEHLAQTAHAPGSAVTVIDTNLIELALTRFGGGSVSSIAAIGAGDDDPVLSEISNLGRGSLPLTPVHPRVTHLPNGDLRLQWTRRARGSWIWNFSTEVPLVEEAELYRVGIGSPENQAMWEVGETHVYIPASVASSFAGQSAWVRQVGRFGESEALELILLQ
ncbi:GTA baseplate fiber-binding domain-containing protein [Pontixanthobacter luteolus]|uniref:GTA baseplate fiber-binding domain-containing protein n=1 Tax=Pontixanthobacter luteolus TaxID=295089 RepID=UPI0023041B57|nr:phage tail protein [Pontixanthobacter luteolus]